MLLSNPSSAIATIAFMMPFVVAIVFTFWKRSLKFGLAVLNVTLIGKVILSVLILGQSGWALIGNTVFGLILINGIRGFGLYRKWKKP